MKLSRPAPPPPVLNQLTRRELGLQRVPNRRRRRGLRRRAILFNLLALDLLNRRAVAQTDAPRLRADLDDLEIVFLARLERPRALQRPGGRTEARGTFVTPLALFDFRVMAKGFDVFAQFDERAERGDARNLALHDLPDLVLLEPVAPDVVDLLDAQRDAAVLRVDLQHLGGDVLALNDRAYWIFLRNQQPGIRLGLLDAQRDAAVAGLDVQHHHIHFFADLGDFRGVLDFLVPAHLRDVHQAFDPLFQLHEHAVVHDPDDLALHLAARGIFFRRSHPGIGHQLLQSQRYALFLLIKLEDDDVDFLLRLDHVGRMFHAAPAQVRQVQQAVDSAEVHERPIFGHVVQVLRRPQVVLRARQKRAHADIHHNAALDAVHDLTGNGFLGFERRVNL